MIKRLIVKNLNGRFDFDLTFHRDLNILVGQNGCGKTSLLKLMWYVYSGNIYRHPADNIFFDEVLLETFAGSSIRLMGSLLSTDKIRIIINGEDVKFGDKNLTRVIGDDTITFLPVNDWLRIAENNTLFMPTFRRVEGGFSKAHVGKMLSNNLEKFSDYLGRDDLIPPSWEKVVVHDFVASLSSKDIINVVTAKYSDISQELRKLEEAQSEFILKNTSNGKGAEAALKDIQAAVKANDKKRKEILNAMTVLSNFVKKIIKNKEIQLTEKLTLGAGEKINPDQLSFGEKQMLSFLCYNFFADDTIIFIDEPEMSLHGDWQRILFPVLMEQNTTNQFIVASHSPFIYAKYPDKQITLTQKEMVAA